MDPNLQLKYPAACGGDALFCFLHYLKSLTSVARFIAAREGENVARLQFKQKYYFVNKGEVNIDHQILQE
jgi:hypothetical protein